MVGEDRPEISLTTIITLIVLLVFMPPLGIIYLIYTMSRVIKINELQAVTTPANNKYNIRRKQTEKIRQRNNNNIVETPQEEIEQAEKDLNLPEIVEIEKKEDIPKCQICGSVIPEDTIYYACDRCGRDVCPACVVHRKNMDLCPECAGER